MLIYDESSSKEVEQVMIQIQGCDVERGFPVVLTPQHRNLSYREFIEWLDANRSGLKQLLLMEGAFMFRGFPVHSPEDFAAVIEKLDLGQFVNYIGGDSPRDKVRDKVYTSTEAPPSLHIPLHQEMSFIRYYPKHIYFYCDTASAAGGATIIGDARKIYADIDAEVRKVFTAKGITYISRYFDRSWLLETLNRFQRSHKSWHEVFEASDKSDVERKCLQNDFAWKWLPHDWIEVRQTRPAVMSHPQTGDKVWFNQVHLYDFNPRLLGWGKYLGASLLYSRPNTRLHDVAFADGTSIPRDYLYHIFDVLDKNTVDYPWQKGDVMVLDNILTMHGRASFRGKRRVLTALTT